MGRRDRILVTGGRGFAGSHLVRRLRAEGRTVLAVGRGEPEAEHEGQVDVRDARAVRGLVLAFEPDAIFHLASNCYLPAVLADPAGSFDVNVLGTLNVLEAIADHRPGARVFVCSSCVVYGDPPPERLPVREDAPLLPVHPYALQKYGAEALARRYAHRGLDAVILRPFNHIGPGMNSKMSVAYFAQALVAMERGRQAQRLAVGNLEPRRDFLHVRDVVDAYVRLLDHPEPPRIVNVASGRSISIRAALDHLISLASVPVEVVSDGARLRPMDVMDLVGDATLLRTTTGWAPTLTAEEALTDLFFASRSAASAES